MTLIASISGIRGTVGGIAGKGLTPPDILKYTSAYTMLLQQMLPGKPLRVIIGRDARLSGEMISNLVSGTLLAMGVDVTDIGLTTTPTAEMAVTMSGSDGGIIITASHNPDQWNALKLLDNKGEFLSEEASLTLLRMAGSGDGRYVQFNKLGKLSFEEGFLVKHIEKILDLPLVDREAVKSANFSIVIDAVNSTGGIAVPALLEALGVTRIHRLNCMPTGVFPHNPEPLPENITEAAEFVLKQKADIGFVVDPDVDRLAVINEIGEPIGEEYTLVMVADYILRNTPGNTVSNLSSTRALRDITENAGGQYVASAVGEVNVVAAMKERQAVIGGEGNGGIICPDLHYGRDALVGIALILTYMARSGKKCSVLRDSYPSYFISKNKIELTHEIDPKQIFSKLAEHYKGHDINRIDGIKINFDKEWVHLRTSNTEPIIRIYAESDMMEKADNLAKKIITDIRDIINGTES